MHKRLVLAIVAIWMATLLSAPGRAAAQTQPPYTGADIVFIIDQSGSMGGLEFGSKEHPLPNDKNRLRFTGPQNAVEWLGSRLLEDDIERRYTFRLGVVYFGDTAEVVDFGLPGAPLPYTTLAPRARQEWELLRKNITAPLSETAWRERRAQEKKPANLGNTNFMVALEKARSLFDQMGKADASRRLKAIVLITDGWPVVLTGSGELVSIGSHMEQVQTYIAQRLPYPNYQIHVFGVSDSDVEYWPLVEPYWQKATHNQARMASSVNEQFFADIQDILNKIIAPLKLGADDELIQCGPTFVPPYLSLVRFTFHKAQKTHRVQIILPDGHQLTPQEATVSGEDDYIETVTVRRPQPGMWRLDCPQGVTIPPKIFKKRVQVRATLLTSPAHQFFPLRFEYEFGDEQGVIKEYADPRYPLLLQLTISNASETLTPTLTMFREGCYAAEALPTSFGEYQVHLVGSSYGITTTRPITVFEHTTVVTIKPTFPRLRAPQQATQLTSTKIELALVDSDGQPVPLLDTRQAPQMQAAVRSGSDEQQFPLELSPGARVGVFVGSFAPQRAGEYTVQVRAQVRPDGKEQIAFDQQAGKFSVGPIQARWAGFIDPPLQYVSTRVAFTLTDQAGQGLVDVIAPGYVLSVTAHITAASSSWTLPLTLEGGSLFAASFRPTLPQPHTLDRPGNQRRWENSD